MTQQREKLIGHWLKTADDDFKAMNNLFASGHYTWALFVGHLVVEKLLKVRYMELENRDAPRIHDLGRLAELAQIKISRPEEKELATLTGFNIRARYPDHRFRIYKAATKSYTIKQIEVITKWRERLLRLVSKGSDPS